MNALAILHSLTPTHYRRRRVDAPFRVAGNGLCSDIGAVAGGHAARLRRSHYTGLSARLPIELRPPSPMPSLRCNARAHRDQPLWEGRWCHGLWRFSQKFAIIHTLLSVVQPATAKCRRSGDCIPLISMTSCFWCHSAWASPLRST